MYADIRINFFKSLFRLLSLLGTVFSVSESLAAISAGLTSRSGLCKSVLGGVLAQPERENAMRLRRRGRHMYTSVLGGYVTGSRSVPRAWLSDSFLKNYKRIDSYIPIQRCFSRSAGRRARN
jgi:hypothetical protein